MLVNGKTHVDLRWQGCSCHNSKRDRRKVKKRAKNREKVLLRKEVW